MQWWCWSRSTVAVPATGELACLIGSRTPVRAQRTTKIAVDSGKSYGILMEVGAAPNGIFILPRVTWARAFAGRKEGHVRNVDIAGDLERSAPRNKIASADDIVRFSPAEFFRDAGTVIAVCLGLGLLLQLLLR